MTRNGWHANRNYNYNYAFLAELADECTHNIACVHALTITCNNYHSIITISLPNHIQLILSPTHIPNDYIRTLQKLILWLCSINHKWGLIQAAHNAANYSALHAFYILCNYTMHATCLHDWTIAIYTHFPCIIYIIRLWGLTVITFKHYTSC